MQPLHSLEDTPWYGKRFSGLKPDEQRRFQRYKLIVRDLEDAEDDAVRHLFYRLNQSNVSLNAQELRFSIYKAGVLGLVEEVVERPEWDHFRFFTKQQRRRMLDSEYVSELVIGYLHWPQNKKDNLDAYYRQYASGLPAADEVLQAFGRTLTILREAFPAPHFGGTRWYRKSDFYTLFLAIARGVLPVPENDLTDFASRLSHFSDLVSRPPVAGEPASVTSYREAVERAATDRGRRMRREQSLVAFMVHSPLVEGLDEMPAEVTDEELEQDAADEAADEEYEDRIA